MHISPRLDKVPVLDWSARAVTLRFPELPEDRTIVITVGSNLKDLRAGNQMTESWQLAFSTGDSLDQGVLRGKVIDPKPAGISIFAYHLVDNLADTLDPTRHRPDYVVRTGDDGRFRLAWMRDGLYRVFAVRDNLNNELYTVEADDIGIPDRDVFTGDSSAVAELRFTMHREDTTSPYIQRVTPITSQALRVMFSEEILPFPPPSAAVALRDSASDEALPLLTVLPSLQGRYGWDLYFAESMRETRYKLTLDSLFDASGNALRDDMIVFDGIADADTSRPGMLEYYPRQGATGVPADSAFVFRFSRPVKPDISVSFRDSTGHSLDLLLHWPDMTRVELRHTVLNDEERYTLCIDLATIRDIVSDRSVADTTMCFDFTAGKEGAFGSVTGSFADSVQGAVHVFLKELQDGGVVYRTVADSSGAFSFRRVQEGRFRIEAFIDLDGNGRFSPGSYQPFEAPEPLIRYADTLRVRARWETGGVLLRAE
jgi:hypothetical protein